MIQRVNSLGRKRIAKTNVVIEVQDGSPRTLDAEIGLGGLGFPDAASVIIEGTSAGSSVVQRFECGTVGNLVQPKGLKLDQLTGQNVFFSLKVIDRSEQVGRLLGIAEGLRPETVGEQTISSQSGILPVERRPLGQQLWRLDFQENHVFLLINSEVPELAERIRSDPAFYAMIYPEIVRQILRRAITESGDPDADDDRWSTLWLSFGRKLHHGHENPPEPADAEGIDEWVEMVVDSFCDSHRLKSRYVTNGGEQETA